MIELTRYAPLISRTGSTEELLDRVGAHVELARGERPSSAVRCKLLCCITYSLEPPSGKARDTVHLPTATNY
jgi:hypothetical protein